MNKLKIMFNKYTRLPTVLATKLPTSLSGSYLFLLLGLSILPIPLHANLYEDLNLELPELEELTTDSVQTVTRQDNSIGLNLVRKMRRYLPIIEDPELSQWIIAMGQRLASNAGVAGKLYFLLVDDSDVNASAYDGGVILINTGLVLYTESESELAAVVAHEVAHITQNHLARRRSDASSSLLTTSAAILAGLAVGAQNSDAGSAIVTSALAAQQTQQLAFSRTMEAEADRVGIRTLAQSGYKASGMPALQEKLDRLNDNPNAELFKYLRSHPLSIERVSDTRNLARRFGNQGQESVSYLYAREKIRALSKRVSTRVMPSLKSPAVKNYAAAMNLYYQGRVNESYNLVQKNQQNQQRAEILALAILLNDKKEYQQAFNLLVPSVNLRPSDTALLIPLSTALLGLGQAKAAWQRLVRVIPSEQTSLRFFELKQEVARQLGYHADAYMAAADRNVRIGEYRYAILQLKQAQKLPRLTANELAKVTAKLKRIEAKYGKKQKKGR